MTPDLASDLHLDAPVLSLDDARRAVSTNPDADLIPARLRYVEPPADLITPHGFMYADQTDHPLRRAGFTSDGWNTRLAHAPYDREWRVTTGLFSVALHETVEDWMRYANHPAWGAAYLEILDPKDAGRALSLAIPLHLLSSSVIHSSVEQAARLLTGEDTRRVPHQFSAMYTAWTPREIKYAPLRAAVKNLQRAGLGVHRTVTGTPKDEFTVAFDRLSDEALQAAVNAGFEVDLKDRSICTVAPPHLQVATNAAAITLLEDLAAGQTDVSGRRYRAPWYLPEQIEAAFSELYL